MRINLRCPFQDKDLAKQLGARWDPGLRVWYVENTADLTPFARWIPGHPRDPDAAEPARSSAAARPASPAAVLSPERSRHGGAVVTGPDVITDCGCTALPWEHCACVTQTDHGAGTGVTNRATTRMDARFSPR